MDSADTGVGTRMAAYVLSGRSPVALLIELWDTRAAATPLEADRASAGPLPAGGPAESRQTMDRTEWLPAEHVQTAPDAVQVAWRPTWWSGQSGQTRR